MAAQRQGRMWGYWTEVKLRILKDYLEAFLIASKSQSERVYLDAFAGEGTGTSRVTGDQFSGSSRIALEVGGEAPFTRFRYFEHPSKAAELEAQLKAEFPGKDIRVYPGDCNVEIPRALDDLRALRWAPTFAFIDPDGMEFDWRTLERLAAHKLGYRPEGSDKPEFKVELWLLFPTQGLVRVLALDDEKLTAAHAEQATRLFGTEDWRAIYERRKAGEYDASEARDQYVNLMRWRLENVLGYDTTHPLELTNTRLGSLYHMIFATDHPAGTKIMTSLYTRAAKEIPQMRQEARDRASGQASLDFGEWLGEGETYRYEPPWQPPELREEDVA